MEAERTVRTCADLILAALRQARSPSRRELVDSGLVTAGEADRALRSLKNTGRIQRCALSTGSKASAVRYEPTRTATTAPIDASKLRGPCFEGLLAASSIRMPSLKSQRNWRARIVNDAFAQEERRELAELQKHQRNAARSSHHR